MRWIWGVLVLIAAVVSLSLRGTASATLRVYPGSALAGETVVLLLPDGEVVPPFGVFGAEQASASQYPYAVNVPLGPCLYTDSLFLQALEISFAPESCRTLLVPANAWGGPQTVSVAGLSVTLNVYGQSVVAEPIAQQHQPVARDVNRTASFFLWVDASFEPDVINDVINRVLAVRRWSWGGNIKPFTELEPLNTDTNQPSKTCRGRVQGFTVSDNNNRLGRAIAEFTKALGMASSPTDVAALTASDPLPGYAVPTVGVTTVTKAVPIKVRTEVGFTDTPGLGAGVTIAVLDTGFGKANGSVNNLDVMPYKAINTLWNSDETSTNDEFSADSLGGYIGAHGTAVASFAAGTKFGLAPAARVLSVKVCDKRGLCELPSLWRGTCAALSEAQPMVLNLSLGGDTPSSIERRILADALALNVDVVASSGNRWLLTANNSYVGKLQHFPAAESPSLPIFAVGAVGLESAGDKVWKLGDFSNQGAHVNLLAPGLKVLGIDGCLGLNSLCDKYSGTSFAAPLVSGALARLRSGVAINWTPEDLQQKLLEAQRRPGCPSVGVGYPSGATATIPVLNLSAGCLP